MDNQIDQPVSGSTNMQRILVVDDAADTRLTLSLRLQREGYLVSTANGAADAFKMIELDGLPHLIILDIMMPEVDGFTFAKEVRELSEIPIIFLSAVTDTDTKIEGLTQFAEDYVTKPFDFGELSARIHRVLARAAPQQSSDPEIKIDKRLRVNFAQQYIIVDKKQLALTPTENRILRALYVERGRVVSAPFLLSQVWDTAHQGTIESLWVHMRRLRAKIEADPSDPQYVVTVRGKGYCLPQPQSSGPDE